MFRLTLAVVNPHVSLRPMLLDEALVLLSAVVDHRKEPLIASSEP
jgi:hypothetical protein